MSKVTRFRKAVIIEFILLLALFCFVLFQYILALWPQSYLDMVEGLWNKSPITDVKFVGVNQDWGTSACPDDYEVGSYYTWGGIEAACNCEASSQFTYGWK